MPDVEGTLTHHQFFIELKSTARPARPTTKVRFAVRDREAQIDWLTKRWALAGNAWLLLQVGSGHQAKRYLVPGKHAQKVYDGVTEDHLGHMSCIPESATPQSVLEVASRRNQPT